MISVNIASHKARFPYLLKAIETILNQSVQPDVINVYLNKVKKVPKELEHLTEKVNFQVGKDLGASGKFYFLRDQNKGVYITADDDLEYPESFVSYLSDAVHRYRGCAVGFHGLIYADGRDSYESGWSKKIMFSDGLERDYRVDVIGTGCMAFAPTWFPDLSPETFSEKNMCDLEFSKHMEENNAARICLTRRTAYITEQEGSQETAIWKGVVKDDSKQTEMLQSFGRETMDANFKMIHPYLPSELSDANIEWGHIKAILNEIEHGDNVCIFGGGESDRFFSSQCELTVIEENKEWIGDNPNVTYIHAPLKDGWYDYDLPESSFDHYIIDGPSPKGDRSKILKELARINPDATIFVDDCHRRKDLKIAKQIAADLKKELTLVDGDVKKLAIIR